MEEITAEGIILAKNDGGLPLAPSSLNNGQDWSLPHDIGKVLDGELDSSVRDGYTVHSHGSYTTPPSCTPSATA